jgi:hypothetical protein
MRSDAGKLFQIFVRTLQLIRHILKPLVDIFEVLLGYFSGGYVLNHFAETGQPPGVIMERNN